MIRESEHLGQPTAWISYSFDGLACYSGSWSGLQYQVEVGSPDNWNEISNCIDAFSLNGPWEKFRRTELIEPCKQMKLDSLSEALSLTRGKPVYLHWRVEGRMKCAE